MTIISFFNVLRQGLAGVIRFVALLLSLPSAVLSDIASLVWDENNVKDNQECCISRTR